MNKWLLVFFLMPLVEMYLLIEVGGWIGPWPTIGLVVLTAVVGVWLLRWQGLHTLTRGVAKLNAGELPAREMVEGLLLAVAGAVLVTPGFVTDAVGFALLTPPIRASLAATIMSRVRVESINAGPAPFHPASGADTIDGVAEEVSNRPGQAHRDDRVSNDS